MKLIGIMLLLSLFPVALLPSSASAWFVDHYNPVPNTEDPDQKRMAVWGYFTDTGGYENDYQPSVGDEVGAFWTNLSAVEILIGVTALSLGNVNQGVYGSMTIYGDDPSRTDELSHGLAVFIFS